MKFRSEAIPGTEVMREGIPYLYFGGTSYLGMQTDPDFLERAARFTQTLGTHWGASRAGNLQLDIYRNAEASLASWLGSPACLTLSSGFLAARFLADFFVRLGHPCFFSPNCHEALLPPGAARQPGWEALGMAVARSGDQSGEKPPVVFTDSMGGDRPGPVWELLEQLPRECILVADDSHGLGITGPGGSGSWKPLSSMGFRELLLCGSLGKAMGVTAGLVAGSADRLGELEKTAFFAGASPAPPAGLATLLNSLESGCYLEKLERLQARVCYLQDRVRHLPFLAFQEGYPVLGFRNRMLARYLLDSRVLITDFDYAAEGDSTSQSRIVVTAAHQEPQLLRLAELLAEFRDS